MAIEADALNERVAALEVKLSSAYDALQRMDGRLDGKLDAISNQLSIVNQHAVRLTYVEARLEELSSTVAQNTKSIATAQGGWRTIIGFTSLGAVVMQIFHLIVGGK